MIYSSWYMERGRLKLPNLGHILPFYPLKTRKIKILKKWKNLLEISSFYTCVPKIMIIWCTVPEIRSETDRIFCHFGLFFALLPPKDSGNQICRKKNGRYHHFRYVYQKLRSYPRFLTGFGMLIFFTNLRVMEFQVRYLALFLLFSVTDAFEWFWMGSLHMDIKLMVESFKAQFLIQLLYYNIICYFPTIH